MKRKNAVLILVLIILAALAALGAGIMRQKPEDDAGYCTDDYSEIYKNQLQIIFGED